MELIKFLTKTKKTFFNSDRMPGDYPVQYYGGADNRVYGIIEISENKLLIRRLVTTKYDYKKGKIILSKNQGGVLVQLGATDEGMEEINYTANINNYVEAGYILNDIIKEESKLHPVEDNPIFRTKPPVKKS